MSIIGAILGDIVGSQYEGERCENPYTCELFTEDCMYTDDTVMSLAVKHALDTGIDYVRSFKIVGRMYPNCGFGGYFHQWIMGDATDSYNSWGNGAAMRVSYVADKYDDLEEVAREARKTALVTHNHPEGVKAAEVTAVCIWMAKQNISKDDIYAYVLSKYPPEEYEWSIDKDLGYLREQYQWSVKAQDSVPVAMRCFYESDSYENFLRNVLSLECDADTLCCIGGSVAEEYYHGTGFDTAALLEKYLAKPLLHILNGEYGYIIKHNNFELSEYLKKEGIPEKIDTFIKLYYGKNPFFFNGAYVQVPKKHAYVLSSEELIEDYDELNSICKKMEIEIV